MWDFFADFLDFFKIFNRWDQPKTVAVTRCGDIICDDGVHANTHNFFFSPSPCLFPMSYGIIVLSERRKALCRAQTPAAACADFTMNLFDIIGPIMVGPSSSHTAGAVRIGLIARRLMGEPIHSVTLCLHGSFLATGKGHGTDRALVAGLLGMNPDDIRIPQSFDLAQQSGLDFHFSSVNLKDVHPNTVVLKMTGKSGRNLEIVASSIGGGRIQICQIDGLKVNFSGEMPTLIVHNIDQPGYVTEVTSVLGSKHINIATMQLYRDIRGGHAIMVIECDDEIPPIVIQWLEQMSGVLKVTYLSLNADEKASQ